MTRPVTLTDQASAARIAARVAAAGAQRPYPDTRRRVAAQQAARYAVRRAQETRAALTWGKDTRPPGNGRHRAAGSRTVSTDPRTLPAAVRAALGIDQDGRPAEVTLDRTLLDRLRAEADRLTADVTRAEHAQADAEPPGCPGCVFCTGQPRDLAPADDSLRDRLVRAANSRYGTDAVHALIVDALMPTINAALDQARTEGAAQ